MAYLNERGVQALTSEIKAYADASYLPGAPLAAVYDPTASYSVGDYCLYSGLLYKCNTAIGSSGEAWTPAHWTETTVTGELSYFAQRIGTVLLPKLSWNGTPYQQTVTLPGVRVTAKSKVDLQPNETVLQQMVNDATTTIFISNNNGVLTAYAIGACPSTDLTFQYSIYETVSV